LRHRCLRRYPAELAQVVRIGSDTGRRRTMVSRKYLQVAYNQRLEGSSVRPSSISSGVGMTDRGWMEPIVERVVTQVLENHADQLRTEIVRRVMEEIAAQPATESPASANSADLARAVSEIELGTSQ